MSRALAMKPPIRAPRIPIAVVPKQPPGSVRPGTRARAMRPANSPRKIQAMIPMRLGPYLSLGATPRLLARAGVVGQVPDDVAGGADARIDRCEQPPHRRDPTKRRGPDRP